LAGLRDEPLGGNSIPHAIEFRTKGTLRKKATVWWAWDVAACGIEANKIASKTHPEVENATP
jgi:hypothetical protein